MDHSQVGQVSWELALWCSILGLLIVRPILTALTEVLIPCWLARRDARRGRQATAQAWAEFHATHIERHHA